MEAAVTGCFSTGIESFCCGSCYCYYYCCCCCCYCCCCCCSYSYSNYYYSYYFCYCYCYCCCCWRGCKSQSRFHFLSRASIRERDDRTAATCLIQAAGWPPY